MTELESYYLRAYRALEALMMEADDRDDAFGQWARDNVLDDLWAQLSESERQSLNNRDTMDAGKAAREAGFNAAYQRWTDFVSKHGRGGDPAERERIIAEVCESAYLARMPK